MILIRRIVGDSMRPNFSPGQIVIGSKIKKPKIGDVVIVDVDNLQIIKRVADIDKENIFLLGDNSDKSKDSRSYGWLPKTCIKGTIL